MQRFKTMWKEKVISKHLKMPESIYLKFQQEADDGHGSNLSLLLRKILAERYKIKAPKTVL